VFAVQTAWVQNLSLQDNITFGLPMQQDHYRAVLHACSLEPDIEMLPQGDQSSAGLRGMNLSGGQRQRLNLARCAYFDADTVLLDNALRHVHALSALWKHGVLG
jgi:ATP-binding cassette, subfamily C (CFTR/MRP), member 1